ncbi:substrate-binding domain-containing protein [Fontivita pretiosa]|uniref:AraC family transcriptional regulator n=1 Tax=Fontivita pretiosa TaxID=2989684 RepID=UPI003D174C1F
MARTRKRVALLIESQIAPRRRMLEGVARYVHEHEPWDIYLKPYGVDYSLRQWARNWSGDGIIAAIWTDRPQHLLQAEVPVVDLVGCLPDAPLVHTNDLSVGRLAADHLLERGYRNFAFVGYESAWSVARQRGFEQRIRDFGCTSEIHQFIITRLASSGPRAWERRQTQLANWVRKLPKPIGVMTCTDLLGQQFLEACSRADVAVPEQVAVIGADNDELICAVSIPPLSSVIINDLQRGYQAAALLDRLMAGLPPPQEPVYIEPAGVVARASTDILAIADQAVVAALRFIRDHACEPIGVNDVVQHVPMSRRMLERRFHRAVGRSIHDEIVRVRLNRAVELLCATELKLETIAARTGFNTASYMGAVFRRLLGMTPGCYRDGSKRLGGHVVQGPLPGNTAVSASTSRR